MITGIFQKKYAVYWIIALSFILRVIGMDKSFQGDEFSSIVDARYLAAIPDALLSDTHPPLYFYILHFFTKISMNESFLRISSVIPGVALCYVVYLIARSIFNETAAIGSILLVSFAPIAIWSSQYVRTYSIAAFFTGLSVYYLVNILERDEARRGDWVGYIVSSAASIYTFYFSALIIIAENIYIFFFSRKKVLLKSWILSQFALLAIYIPWMPYFLFQRSSYVGHPQMVNQVGFYIGNIHVGGILRSISGLLGFDPRFIAKDVISGLPMVKAGALAGGILLVLFAVWVKAKVFKNLMLNENEKVGLRLLTVLALIPFLIALLLHQALGIILMSHYFIASFAFLAIASSGLAVKVLPKKICFIVLAAVILLYSTRLLGIYRDREMDYRAAHDYVRSIAVKDSTLVSPSFGGVFEHYFADIGGRLCMEDIKAWRAILRGAIVITFPKKLENKGLEKRFKSYLVSRGYDLVSSAAFGDITVERYVK